MQNLSNDTLIEKIEELALKENQATIAFLVCLAELDRRRFYLELGYSSMFAFCTHRLKYSEPAAYRRICASRIIRDYPGVLRLLERQEVNLTTLALIHPILKTENNAEEIFKNISGKSKKEVEEFVGRHKPAVSVIRERIAPVRVQPKISTQHKNTEEPPKLDTQPPITFSRESKTSDNLKEEPDDLKFKISFSVNKPVMTKLKRLQELKPYKTIEDLFETLIDAYLKRIAPEYKKESEAGSQTRYIPAGLRAKILKRDNYQCSFIGKYGQRCECKKDLEIDHIYPVALGGKTEFSNLRALCGSHNRFEAIKILGQSHLLTNNLRI